MRAVVVDRFMAPEALRVSEVPRPCPGPGELGLAVRAAGCNFSDLLMLKGEYQVKPPFPFVPGSEVAGVVAALGAGVAGFAVGDRVLARCGTGGFAEEVVVPAAAAVKLPGSMSFEAGAALSTVYPTSYAALVWRAGLAAGETVLVHAAAGGVGLAAVQIARALGARVLATAGGREKCEIARRAGAELVVDSREGDFVERVLEATGGRGADVIYDSVGGETTDRSLKCIAWNGRLLVIGFASGEIPSVKLNRVMLKNVSLVGFHWSAYPEREPARIAECFEGLFALAARGGIEPLVSARHPLERAGEALVALGARETVGKVVLVP
ncbi:MAG: NADPH:quinone oxidoreductase family protein [Deltaproteobacteria bacterium]|nr:NADPH:quinone oxidoreductase family protein [Deltaproteobacteria bacterium]